MLALAFGTVSFLYATVGQAGGTAFLALMAFASFPASEMRPTALLLNIVAAAFSTWLFNKGARVDWRKLNPFLFASLPTALVGGFIILDERVYNLLTGIVLLTAATILILRRADDGKADRTAPVWGAICVGAAVGFISGLTGVGGGVFLAPILIALQWASPKQTAAMSAPFILANSAVGLFGAMYVGHTPSSQTWFFAIAALIGSFAGTMIGMRWLSQTATRVILAVVLGTAGLQLVFL